MWTILKLLSIFGLWFFGNGTWILSLTNLAWMLFKDDTLFSWWWPLSFGIGTLIAFILFFVAMLED